MTSFGRSVSRVEDADLLVGSARFLDDLPASKDALHLKVLRSPFAHATFDVDSVPEPTDATIFTYPDVAHLKWAHLLPGPPNRHPLAQERTRYVGEAIAAVVCEDPRRALDLLTEIWIDFEPLPASVSVKEALRGDAALVYESLESNIAYTDESDHDPGVFADADLVIKRVFTNPRMAPGMLEPRTVLAVPDGRNLTVYVGHQNPHGLRKQLLNMFGPAVDDIRVIAPEVGGAFGAKGGLYPEYVLAVHAALATGRPVKFIETRSENLTVTWHGRGQTQRVEAGVKSDGTLVALRIEVDADFGAAIDAQRWSVLLMRLMFSGAYRIPKIEWTVRGVFTNTAPMGVFRGAGRPQAAYLVERIIDEIARELEIDPAVVRERNFIAVAEFPYETGTEATYDSGNYAEALRLALETASYDRIRKEQSEAASSGDGPLIGIGIASYVELTAGGEEYAKVDLDGTGHVTVRTGTSPHGQGHDTTWAQLVSDQLGLPIERTTVIHGDTAKVARGGGTMGSRSAVLGGSSVWAAADEIATILRDTAAQLLEAAPEDIRLNDGRATVAGSDIGLDFDTLVAEHGGHITATDVFKEPAQTYPFGTHICVLEIDRVTGEIEITQYIAVDDCGRVINPAIVEGQLHGGILQGASQALREAIRYDEFGQLLTANLTTYPLPDLTMAIPITAMRTETPSPLNPLGLKGVGESGVTGATPAVANAVYDALAGLGIREETLTMPFTPARVWSAMNGETP
jgi:carbon-monoxide dehydrogenase large subunit